jgi:hypothetical protein
MLVFRVAMRSPDRIDQAELGKVHHSKQVRREVTRRKWPWTSVGK